MPAQAHLFLQRQESQTVAYTNEKSLQFLEERNNSLNKGETLKTSELWQDSNPDSNHSTTRLFLIYIYVTDYFVCAF